MQFDDSRRRRRRLERMEEVYGFEMTDGSGDFFGYTATTCSPTSGAGPASPTATAGCC
jgi:hypothetical protein